jgi:probable HAF family extracellular repeat protein
MKRLLSTHLVATGLLFVFSSFVQAQQEVIDLGTLDGYTKSTAYSINNNGQVIGWVENSSGESRACLFNFSGIGKNIDLGTLGGNNSKAFSINDNSQIVGSAYTERGNEHACLFDSAGTKNSIDLGTFGGGFLGGYNSAATTINNKGQIVGWATGGTTSLISHACLFDSSGGANNIDLTPSSSSMFSTAWSINNNGQIVGSSFFLACLFDPTGAENNIDLGTLVPDSSLAWDINDNGQIVGDSGNWMYSHACLFDATGGENNIDLGAPDGYLSVACSINNEEQIVGNVHIIGGHPETDDYRAYLFDPTGGENNIDLNTLLPQGSGWTLTDAYSINDNGWIVGQGINPNGDYHAYLLTPEPITLVLLGLGGLSVIRRKQ